MDTIDFNLLAANFGQTIAGPAAIGQIVPEPMTTVTLSAIIGAHFLRRRRRRERLPA